MLAWHSTAATVVVVVLCLWSSSQKKRGKLKVSWEHWKISEPSTHKGGGEEEEKNRETVNRKRENDALLLCTRPFYYLFYMAYVFLIPRQFDAANGYSHCAFGPSKVFVDI